VGELFRSAAGVRMSPSVILLSVSVYLVALVVIVVLTRATARRLVGALVGGVATGVVTAIVDMLGEALGWWHFAIDFGAYFLTWTVMAVAWGVTVAPCFLVSWRLARRFGWRGPAALALLSTVIGPPRDLALMAQHPEWGYYGPGWAPVLGIAAIYAVLIPLGHWVTGLVAGPSRGSPLARRPWEVAETSAAGDPARHVAFWDFQATRGGPGGCREKGDKADAPAT
jgi:hypothetical protein